MAKIGIFWVYKKRVIGKHRELREGNENVPGLIDSPDAHVDLWEKDKIYIGQFPELRGTEYQTIPRGRILYSTKSKKMIVYMDKTLHSSDTKKVIADFFDLNYVKIAWKTDGHYTTESHELDGLLDGD